VAERRRWGGLYEAMEDPEKTQRAQGLTQAKARVVETCLPEGGRARNREQPEVHRGKGRGRGCLGTLIGRDLYKKEKRTGRWKELRRGTYPTGRGITEKSRIITAKRGGGG